MSSAKLHSEREPVDYRVWERIDSILEGKNISLKKISVDLNISYRTLQNYRAGKTNISIPNLKKICEYLHVEADYFLFGAIDIDRLSMFISVEAALSDLLDSMTFIDRKLVISHVIEPQSNRQHKAMVISPVVRDNYILHREKRRRSPGGGGYDATSGTEVILADLYKKLTV